MAISLMEALNILDSLEITPRYQTLPLEECVGKISAKSYRARYNLPNFDNSAMDGFAIKVADAGKEVKVTQTLLAGSSTDTEVTPGTAIKVMTGAKLPKGTEAIVPIEEVEYRGEEILLPKKIKEKAHMRFAGEDVAEGELLIASGERLDSFKLALLASQGYSYLEVFVPPKVVVFATGNELKMHYEPLSPNAIYNSNTPSIYARAKELGCDVRFVRQSSDDLQSIKRLIHNALDADLIITSGGVSVGEADFTKEAFKAMGMEIYFSKIDIKPGKPTTLGRIGSTFVLNLPGNPLAAQLNFELFGRLLINRLRGLTASYHKPILAKLKTKLTLKPGRDTLIPGYFDGVFFHPAPKRAPGMVSTMARANGFIIAHKEATELKGEVKFLPFWEFYAKEQEEIVSS